MSRIGKAPVAFDDKVQVTIAGSSIKLKGQKASLAVDLTGNIGAKVDGKLIVLSRPDDSKESKSLHGMYRALLQNAVTGLTKGFSKSLELHGVGYRAAVSGKKLDLSLGFSHQISYDIPEGIEIKVDKQTNITVTGASKSQVGQVAADIRSFRPPEPYLGKGVRYSDEKLRRKAGKSAGK